MTLPPSKPRTGPGDGSAFTTPGEQGELHRVDLLSVPMHETGHLLGHDHEADGLMAETLPASIRRQPGEDAGLADLTVIFSPSDFPVDTRTGFDPTYPWGRRRK